MLDHNILAPEHSSKHNLPTSVPPPSTPPFPSSTPHRLEWPASIIVFFSILLIGAIVYARGFGSELVYDSLSIVGDDPRLKSIDAINVKNIFKESYWWPSFDGREYRPISKLLWALQYSIFGFKDAPQGYQLFNLVLHCLVSFLAFRLLCKFTIPPILAFLAACFFLIHPFGTDVVPNIVGMSDILVLGGLICGMMLFMEILEKPFPQWKFTILFALCSIGTVLAKENGIAIIPLLFWYCCTIGRDQSTNWWAANKKHISYLLALSTILIGIVLAAIIPRFFFTNTTESIKYNAIHNPLVIQPPLTARINALSIIGGNILGSLLPLETSPDYSYDQIPTASFPPQTALDWLVLTKATATLLIGLVGLVIYKRLPAISFSIGAFFILLMPTANIFLFIGTIRADRLSYPAILPVAISFGLIVNYFIASTSRNKGKYYQHINNILPIAGILMIILSGILTHFRSADWRNSAFLWKSAYFSSPDSFKTKLAYGGSLCRNAMSLEDFDQGLNLLRAANLQLSSSPYIEMHTNRDVRKGLAQGLIDRALFLINKGEIHLSVTDLTEAESLLLEVVELNNSRGHSESEKTTQDATILATLAEIKKCLNKPAEALALLEKYQEGFGLELSKEYYAALARAKVETGDWETGFALMLQVILLDSKDTDRWIEAAWIWKHHSVPKWARFFKPATETIDSSAENLNLDNPEIAQRLHLAANRLIMILDQKERLLEKRYIERLVRVRIGEITFKRDTPKTAN